MLYPPPADTSRVSIGSPNILPPEIAPVSSLNSMCSQDDVNEGQQSETCRDRGDRRRGRSGKLTTTSPHESNEEELELASMPALVAGSVSIERDRTVTRKIVSQMKLAGESTSGHKPVESGVVPKSPDTLGSKSLSRNTSSDSMSLSETDVTAASPAAVLNHGSRIVAGLIRPTMRRGRTASAARSPAQQVHSGGDELLGSPGGDDSLMSNQSLLDMNTEDPFKAGEGVRANPPHSSPYAQSPLANTDHSSTSETDVGGGVFWSQLELSKISNASSKCTSSAAVRASPANSHRTHFDVCTCSPAGSTDLEGAAMANSGTVNATHTAAEAACQEAGIVPGTRGVADADVQDSSRHSVDVTGKPIGCSTLLEATQERSRGGGDGDDVAHDEAGGTQRRKWSREPFILQAC